MSDLSQPVAATGLHRTPYFETVEIRERNTVAATTAMLSDAGRADRDRLLIAAAATLLVSLPGVIDKLAVGPVEISGLPVTALRVGMLIALLYFSLSFATQASMDFMRWRASFRLALLEMGSRLHLHQEGLDRRFAEALERSDRMTERLASHRTEVDPLFAELAGIRESVQPDFARVQELQGQIEAAHQRFSEETRQDDEPAGTNEDFRAVLGVGRRVDVLRWMMRTNVIATITLPLVMAAVAAGPVAYMLWLG